MFDNELLTLIPAIMQLKVQPMHTELPVVLSLHKKDKKKMVTKGRKSKSIKIHIKMKMKRWQREL